MEFLGFDWVWAGTNEPFERVMFHYYIACCVFGLLCLRRISLAGRPVAHSDRKLGTKHKEAEAERVEILESLKSGSKLVDSGHSKRKGDDLVLPKADRLDADVEKEALCSPLIPKSEMEAAKVATVTLSTTGGYRLPKQAYDVMKELSKEAGSGEGAADGHDSFICPSDRGLMQSEVELHDGLFERLKDILKYPYFMMKASDVKAWPKTEEFLPIVQVDNWAVLKPSDQGVDVLRLPVDKIPVILHAEYAAGLLTITGLNLEDADLYIAAENAFYTLKLKVWRFLKGTKYTRFKSNPAWRLFSDTQEDIASVAFRLKWSDLKTVFVYATKRVPLGGDGETVEAMSKSVRVVDRFWRTVLGLWIPTIALLVFSFYSFRGLLINRNFPGKAILGSIQPYYGFYFVLAIIAFCKYVMGKRITEAVKYHAESLAGGIGQGVMVFYYGLRSLKGPGMEFPKYESRRKAPPYPRPPLGPPPSAVPMSKKDDHDQKPSADRFLQSARATKKPSEDDQAAIIKSVDEPDWEWPAFDEFDDKKGNTKLVKHADEARDEVSPFRAVYRRKANTLWPDAVRVDLFSVPLINIVQKFLPENGDLRCLETPPIRVRDLFVVLDGLKNHLNEVPLPACGADASHDLGSQGVGNNSEVAKTEDKGPLHLQHLVRFMDKEFKDVSVRLRRMTEEKRVAWDMIWAFLTPGRKVVYTCDHSQEALAAVVSKSTYTKLQKEWVLHVDLEVWDYDGRSYRRCQTRRNIDKFEGEHAFSSLVVRPIEMEGVAPEILDQGFLAKGKRFHELAMKNSHLFMHYSGPMFRLNKVDRTNGQVDLLKDHADGRVMIDLSSFAKMNPAYPMRNAKPPVASYGASSTERRSRFEEIVPDANYVVRESGWESMGGTEVCDGNLIFAPAIVYGFSFTLKKWGSFSVSGFSDISFDTNAFDALVMEPDSKQFVYNLVSQYIATPADPSQELQQIDPIPHKGEGCIFLCYGPPGTGKTLTAESVAENMHRPLWSFSISELGVGPSDLEQALVKILDIAATWRSVLLIDEADVLLEKRSSRQNLVRNATTGIFLRFLEYYRGVLFLTTNRIGTFDDALRSRISMFLHYPKLSVEHKGQVWATLLERAGVTGVTADFIRQMAAEDLNGREIRNTIHTAQIWAKSKGEPLEQSHVLYATKVLLSSLRTLADNSMNLSDDEK